MREGGAFLLIVFGLLLAYFAVRGKLSCFGSAWSCATGSTGQGAVTGATAASPFTSTGGLPLTPTLPATFAPTGIVGG